MYFESIVAYKAGTFYHFSHMNQKRLTRKCTSYGNIIEQDFFLEAKVSWPK